GSGFGRTNSLPCTAVLTSGFYLTFPLFREEPFILPRGGCVPAWPRGHGDDISHVWHEKY
ncbi:hypothetical protein, partial [Crenobacter luteus]|uniref:hypothetical protein n=1 Tax=Crenobacter luteus TaxID=1452487 RepID=UPI001A9D2350